MFVPSFFGRCQSASEFLLGVEVIIHEVFPPVNSSELDTRPKPLRSLLNPHLHVIFEQDLGYTEHMCTRIKSNDRQNR